MEEQVICPFCFTEIIWDEELGPEELCPHCGSDLGNYRTLQFGVGSEDELEEDEDEDKEEAVHAPAKQSEWSDEEDSEESDHTEWLEKGEGYRQTNTAWLAAENTLQGVIDDQAEAPECPVCRQYMLETGTQTISEQQFVPAIAPSIGGPVLPTPFQVIWYLCPGCFHTSSQLSQADRDLMVKRLASKE